jgi:hypothetical protein
MQKSGSTALATIGIVRVASAAVTAIFLNAGAALAQNSPWCATMATDGTTQCNFDTEQQCLQTVSGIGGECSQNPAGSTDSPQSGLGLLPLQLQNPGPSSGFGGSYVPPPPDE